MITTLAQLRALNPRDFDNTDVPPEEMLQWLSIVEAGWMHPGDPNMPHAELFSGLCSNGFFVCQKLLRFPNVCEILGRQLGRKLSVAMVRLGIDNFDAVVGSPYSSITISYEVAKFFGAMHGIPQKDPADPKGKKMIWKEEFPMGTKILRVEELVTTSASTQEITRAITTQNPYPVEFLPVVGVFVHRPPQVPMDYWNMLMVSLVEKEIWAVPPDKCDLCKQGSRPLKPKGANWALLTGKKQ
jgi:hypothetical protein